MDQAALESNLVTLWVQPFSGLDPQKVYWAYQELRSPAPGPCISLELGTEVKIGFDSITTAYDGTKPNGQEIQRTASGHREVTLKLEAFSPNTVERGGAPTARSTLAKVHAALSLPGLRSSLNAAGIGVIDEGTILWLPAIQKAAWEGRAVLETRLRVVETVAEALGYIARVNMNGVVNKGAADEDDFTVTVNAP